MFTDVDGDGVGDKCDLDNDNDGILDSDEGSCTPFEINFESGKEGWTKGNTGNELNHSTETNTAAGCPISNVPAAPSGNFIVASDESSDVGTVTFFSPDDMNLNLSSSLNSTMSFYWYNGTPTGEGNQIVNKLKVTLVGSGGVTVSGKIDVTGLAPTEMVHQII
ncbi:MAG: hypothetical protein CSA38_04980 [Flavobacteriales bacterium]|nr:MAG: hypothetical protein CSA38_04980 [Flavobacteriales bacterium]